MRKAVECPRCGKTIVRRRPSQGLGEQLLAGLLIYPFRCQLCAYRYRAFLGRPSFAPRREFVRLPVQYPVSMWEARSADRRAITEGTLIDLSLRGCAINCATPFKTGTMLRLHVHLPVEAAPLAIDGAVVRYCGKDRLGVQFQAIGPAEEARLSQVVEQLWYAAPPPAHSWAFKEKTPG